jgi:RNA polymerase sigma factor for flagellar operon FliA
MQAIQALPGRETLFMEGLPTVRFIARRIHDRLPASVELEDLVSAGTIGLLDAIAKFDETQGVQFKTYAQFRVRGAILDSLREIDWASRALRKQARQIEQSISRLSCKLGRRPEEQEIAADLDLSVSQYQDLIRDLRGIEIGSLNSVESEDGDAQDLSAAIPDFRPLPSQILEEKEQKALLARWIDELPERERQVLSLYYVEELPMKEIGKLLGVVESRVSQIHTTAVLRLRARANSGGTAPVIV